MKRSLDNFLSRLVFSESGCWIATKRMNLSVSYKGQDVYVITAIFDKFGKTYNGKIQRSCGNLSCYNPDHLLSLSVSERFWSNVNVGDENDCWEWKTYAGTGEYAETSVKGKSISAHRLAYKLTFGDFDESLCVCHHCDNPPCCNPKHLFLGTLQDNVDDREMKGRNKMPHSLGEEHGNHRLTEEQVREIRAKYILRVYSYRKLADEYGVSFGQIRNVVKGRDWGWLE